MTPSELIQVLKDLPPETRIVYPGQLRDIEVEVAFAEDGKLVLSAEHELPGEPARPVARDLDEELLRARESGQGLLVLVHEAYSLLSSARPAYWLLSDDTQEATVWMRRQSELLRVIDSCGAAPQKEKPTGLKGMIESLLGKNASDKRSGV